MLKFGPHVEHILDCPETQKPEHARARALQHTYRVKQICPLLIPVSESELIEFNGKLREEVDAELAAVSEKKLRFVHSELGLSYEMFPKESAKYIKVDPSIDEKQLKIFKTAKDETFLLAKQMQDFMVDPKSKASMQQTTQPDPFSEKCTEP